MYSSVKTEITTTTKQFTIVNNKMREKFNAKGMPYWTPKKIYTICVKKLLKLN